MRGVLKPAGFGTMENIEPVWFDTTRWIGCIDGYGNTTAITKLMEGLDDRGAAVANYASYTALAAAIDTGVVAPGRWATRSEEHTSELQSLMRISYAVFCLKKKNNTKSLTTNTHTAKTLIH